jgi:copper oxidase (laccase) domain-containing protein
MRAEPGSQASQPHNCPRRKPEQIPLGRPWILHARVGGSSRAYGGQALNLGFTPDDSKAAVERNRAAFSPELTAVSRPWPLISLRQVHSDTIRFVEAPSRSQLVGDRLITSIPGLLLANQTADCLPW